MQALSNIKNSKNKVVYIFGDSDLVFSTSGELFNRFWLKQVYKKNQNLKQISAHGFRHAHASLLFESGASLKDAQAILGHADIQTTSNIYTHVTETQNKKVINNFVAFMKNDSQGESNGESKNISN
ncbi:tyrosine-type recombinase/integrase [Enterococcus villorum]|uniref:tyrosine-type recombinase/integrase n=1 Tax=Enterococcus villorum TaxID=112904 RepID=UPI0009C05C4A